MRLQEVGIQRVVQWLCREFNCQVANICRDQIVLKQMLTHIIHRIKEGITLGLLQSDLI